jgi:hypothetical protein
MRRMMRAPSPSMMVALMALLVALGGTGYAAFKLPKNSVGTKQLKNGAVTNAKVKNGTLTGAKINASTLGTVPSASTARSAATATSADPAAFAHVNDDGTLDTANSKNVGNATHGSLAGFYCISGIPFTPRGSQVTPDIVGFVDVLAQVHTPGYSGCPAGTQATVVTRHSSGTPVSNAFFVVFYR